MSGYINIPKTPHRLFILLTVVICSQKTVNHEQTTIQDLPILSCKAVFAAVLCKVGNYQTHTPLKENPYSGAGITTKNSESGLERRHDRAGQGCGRRFVFSYRASIPFCWLSLSIYVPISWTYICVPILVVFLLLIVAQLGLRIFVSQLYVKEGQAHHSQRRRYE